MNLKPPVPPDDDSNDPDERYASERISQRSKPWVGYVALLLSGAYIVLGVMLALVPSGKMAIPDMYRYVVAGLLGVYGVWRIVRTYNRYFR